jgi:hypothetical protein
MIDQQAGALALGDVVAQNRGRNHAVTGLVAVSRGACRQ